MKHFYCCFLVVFLSYTNAYSQLHYVQCILVGVETEEQCRLLEQVLQTHSGMESVRADTHSDNLLAFFSSTYTYTESDFIAWLQPLGIEIICFRKGVMGAQPIVKLDKRNCEILEKK